MAFQSNTQPPDMIGLALTLMNMKRDREIQDRKMELESRKLNFTIDEAERERAKREAFAAAVGTGDRNLIQRVYAQYDPESAAKSILAPTESSGPKLDWIYGEGGRKQRAIVNDDGTMTPVPGAAWVEPRPPITVNVGDSGLNAYQTAQTRDKIISKHEKASEPYVASSGRLNELRGLLEALGNREPTPFESEAAATAFTKGLKPAEAVMRDDIARVLGQGAWNQIKGFLNLPQRASRAQIQQMADALSQVVSVAEMRQRSIDEKYRAMGSDYEVEIPVYAPEANAGAEKPAGNPKPPRGFKPHPTIPGLYINRAGEGWQP